MEIQGGRHPAPGAPSTQGTRDTQLSGLRAPGAPQPFPASSSLLFPLPRSVGFSWGGCGEVSQSQWLAQRRRIWLRPRAGTATPPQGRLLPASSRFLGSVAALSSRRLVATSPEPFLHHPWLSSVRAAVRLSSSGNDITRWTLGSPWRGMTSSGLGYMCRWCFQVNPCSQAPGGCEFGGHVIQLTTGGHRGRGPPGWSSPGSQELLGTTGSGWGRWEDTDTGRGL